MRTEAIRTIAGKEFEEEIWNRKARIQRRSFPSFSEAGSIGGGPPSRSNPLIL